MQICAFDLCDEDHGGKKARGSAQAVRERQRNIGGERDGVGERYLARKEDVGGGGEIEGRRSTKK